MAQQIGLTYLSVTISSGTALSPEVDTGAQTLCGLLVPANWTAAGIYFQVSLDSVNFFVMADGRQPTTNTPVAVAAAASQYVALDPVLFRGVNALKIGSGTSAVPVSQTNTVVLTAVLRQLA